MKSLNLNISYLQQHMKGDCKFEFHKESQNMDCLHFLATGHHSFSHDSVSLHIPWNSRSKPPTLPSLHQLQCFNSEKCPKIKDCIKEFISVCSSVSKLGIYIQFLTNSGLLPYFLIYPDVFESSHPHPGSLAFHLIALITKLGAVQTSTFHSSDQGKLSTGFQNQWTS